MPDMDFLAIKLPYRQTGFFSELVLDYLDQKESVKPFFLYPPTLSGIHKASEARRIFPTDRILLTEVLLEQYRNLPGTEAVLQHIEWLKEENTFTVTTAHQNTLFGGPLYVIYKATHVIRLAQQLNELHPDKKYVPVFFIGSEDADAEELNHFWLQGDKREWKPAQNGAVGRMKADKGLLELMESLSGQLGVLPYGRDAIQLIQRCYAEGVTMSKAFFLLLHELFGSYGLIVLQPDHPKLKARMIPVFEKELKEQPSCKIIQKTNDALLQHGFKPEAFVREINLFYLDNGLRERIVQEGNRFRVLNSQLSFSEKEILSCLHNHPERFSPNVFLRALYQSVILPDAVFTGGGSELAYWLQMKDLFAYFQIPYPVLVLRNSFLWIEKKYGTKIRKLSLVPEDFFNPADNLIKKFISENHNNLLSLKPELNEAEAFYTKLSEKVSVHYPELGQHILSLKAAAGKKLSALERKIEKAIKKRQADSLRQIAYLKNILFPDGTLQERRENFLYYYSLWGREFLTRLYEESQGLEQEFVILEEK
ncbi:MAG: bacillithiol biosynthesis cysteine-adding enzyme BshC [Chitinophagaceae bacterium]|nr:bacillithiol biosynthesis cysteine-adding enzyme BshC [Chitinophagaceae bacterium]